VESSNDLILPYLRALVILQLERLHDESDVKPELLLSRAGIPLPDIAQMVGKNYAAVAKAISRAKGGTQKERLQRAMTHEPEPAE